MVKKSKGLTLRWIVMALVVGMLGAGASYAACPDELAAYWKLDETTGTTYFDFIGDNDGAGNLPPTPEAVGRVDGAQDFDGSTMGIDVEPSPIFDWRSTQSFTIELWVQTDGVNPPGGGVPDNEVLIGRVESGGIQWWIGLENGTGNASALLIDGYGNALDLIGAGPSLTANINWRHVALVRDGSTNEFSLYVDGTSVATDTQAFPKGISSTTAKLNIGYLGTGFRFDGLMDEVAIYRRALSDTEVQARFTAGPGGTDVCGGSAAPIQSDAPFPEDTISLWKLEEAGGSTYVDLFGDNDGAGSANPVPVAEPGGKVNGAQDFDGSTMGIDVEPSSDFDWLGSESFTIELWVQTDGVNPPGGGVPDNEVLIGRNESGGIQWWIGLENGTGDASVLLIDVDGNALDLIGAGPSLTANTNWRHVALVRDGSTSTTTLYIDGNPEATDNTFVSTAGFGSATAKLQIGYLGSGFRFDGLLDEVAMYDRALDQAEIQSHISEADAGRGVELSQPGPVAVATASPTSAASGDSVTLDGSGSSDSNGTITGYLWEQTAGPAATLSGATTATAGFDAPSVSSNQTLTFRLTVTDNDGLSSNDSVSVTVTPAGTTTPPPVGGGGGGGGCFINSLF